ncbi:MAG: hypothetical protein JNL12_21530 [Planctomycetes bacterium]|nr:hypothetical protein [Planctomycetota bacterium]
MRAIVLPLLLFTQAACWSPRYFAPREHVGSTGPGGFPAATYAVPGAEAGQPGLGEVRLWSEGAKALYDEDDEEVVRLQIGFELENTGDEPFELDPASLRCEELLLDGLLQPSMTPTRIDGDPIAMPGSTARFGVTFEPSTTVPGDIDSFSIRFRVNAGTREALAQVTPFEPRRAEPGRTVYYAGLGPAWGWGWGWGWGFGARCR